MSRDESSDPNFDDRVQHILRRIEGVLADWPRDEVIQLAGMMAARELKRERAALAALLQPETDP